MARMTTRDLMEIVEKLETIIELMDERGIESIPLRSSTYGIHSDFIGICGYDGGYLCMNYTIEDIENGEYE